MRKNDSDLFKHYLMKIRFMLCSSSRKRTNFIRKHNLFNGIGNNVVWQPHMLPMDGKLLRLHSNIKIAADVKFITHDMLYDLFNHMDDVENYRQNLGCIEVMDNVFIGLGSIIMPNIRIGPNAIVAAGSVVTKDVHEGTIVGGNPARVIGSFYDIKKRQLEKTEGIGKISRFNEKDIERAWANFSNLKGEKKEDKISEDICDAGISEVSDGQACKKGG